MAGNWTKEQTGILILKQNGGKEEMAESKVIPKKRKGRKKKVIAVSLSGKYAILIAKSNKQWTEIYLYQYQQDCKISVLSQR